MSSRDAFRSTLQNGGLVVGVGAGDALQARLIEECEFDFVWISSFAVAASLALPEDPRYSLNEFNQRVREITRAVLLPTVVDAPITYLDRSAASGVLRVYSECGVAGLSVEDKSGVKVNSLDFERHQVLMSGEDFCDLLRWIKATAPDLFLIARVEALVAGSTCDETLRRGRLYADAGADAVIIHSRSPQPADIIEVVKRWDRQCPMGLIPTTYSSLTEPMMMQLGAVRFVIYANQMVRAAVQVQRDVLAEIKCVQGVHTLTDRLASVEGILALQTLREPRRE